MDDLLTFEQAAKLCPTKPSPNTVSGWRREGIKARSGKKVFLQCTRIGKQYHTTRKRMEQFFDAIATEDHAAKPVNRRIVRSGSDARSRLIQEGVLT